MADRFTGLRIIGLAGILLAQGCVTAPGTSDKVDQHVALERWNQCLERFEKDARSRCDGHRRDVLAAFPTYLGDHINVRLNRQVALNRTHALISTHLPLTMDGASALTSQDTLR